MPTNKDKRATLDNDLYAEYLLEVVNDADAMALCSLSQLDAHLVLMTRMTYALLMLALAVRIESGVKPQMPARG